MKVLCEVSVEKESPDENGDITFEKRQYWLWHWGLDQTIIETDHGPVPVSYTVAICEDVETGQIMVFRPEQLKIFGKEIK